MKRRDLDSRLERAFTQAPPELSDRIELAFLRGEQAMKTRYKITVALSAAAAFAVLVLGIALAAGALTRPRQDAVVAAVDGAEGIAAESTPTPMPAAEPEYTPTPMPAPAQGEDLTAQICYATVQGEFFHRYENCSGMQDAIPWTQAAALATGKQPCPVCLPALASDAPTVSPMPPEQDGGTVYYSDTDAYYHGDDICCGRLQDRSRTLDEALRDGKERCPICQPVVPDGYNLFLAAFGQGLDALYPGFTYAFRGMNSAHYDNNTWYVTDGRRILGACTIYDHYSGEGANGEDEVCFTLTSDGYNDLWRFLSEAPQTQWGMILNEATEDAVNNALLAEGVEEVADGMALTSVRAVVKPSGLIESAWMRFYDAKRTIRADAGFALQEDGGYEIWNSVNGIAIG